MQITNILNIFMIFLLFKEKIGKIIYDSLVIHGLTAQVFQRIIFPFNVYDDGIDNCSKILISFSFILHPPRQLLY